MPEIKKLPFLPHFQLKISLSPIFLRFQIFPYPTKKVGENLSQCTFCGRGLKCIKLFNLHSSKQRRSVDLLPSSALQLRSAHRKKLKTGSDGSLSTIQHEKYTKTEDCGFFLNIEKQLKDQDGHISSLNCAIIKSNSTKILCPDAMRRIRA